MAYTNIFCFNCILLQKLLCLFHANRIYYYNTALKILITDNIRYLSYFYEVWAIEWFTVVVLFLWLWICDINLLDIFEFWIFCTLLNTDGATVSHSTDIDSCQEQIWVTSILPYISFLFFLNYTLAVFFSVVSPTTGYPFYCHSMFLEVFCYLFFSLRVLFPFWLCI